MTPILTILIPLFVSMLEGCLNRKPTAEDVKKAATDQFDPATGTFNQQFVESKRRMTKHAMRRTGVRHPSNEQLDAQTVELLTMAKDGDKPQLTAALAMSHGEDDDA